MLKGGCKAITDNAQFFKSALAAAGADALSEIGRRAAEYARAEAPVRTGRLRDSIGFEIEGTGVAVGSDCAYAPQVELGARAFLRPALEGHGEEYREVIEEALRGE